MHIKEELNEGPRIQGKQTEQKRKTRAKNKNVTPEISKWHRQTNQNPPKDTSSRLLCLIIYAERTSTSTLVLGYPLHGPPRHVGIYYLFS